MVKLTGKKIFTILHIKILFIKTYDNAVLLCSLMIIFFRHNMDSQVFKVCSLTLFSIIMPFDAFEICSIFHNIFSMLSENIK